MRSSNVMKPGVDEVFVGIDWGASHHHLCAVGRGRPGSSPGGSAVVRSHTSAPAALSTIGARGEQ